MDKTISLINLLTLKVEKHFIAHEDEWGGKKQKIDQLLTASPATQKPYFILDGTHYVPHRRTDLNSFKSADAIICSAYKFFGPHIGVMAFKG